MKKLLFILLVLCSFTASSQVYILRSFNAFYGLNNTSNSTGISLLITINFNEDIIKIDNGFSDVFYLRDIYKQIRYQDDNGNYFNTVTYNAYDKDGISCMVPISTWEEINLMAIGVIYENIMYGYYCKIINL